MMNKCHDCRLKSIPYCIELNSPAVGYKGEGCPYREFVRTEVGKFYACRMYINEQFGEGVDKYGHQKIYGTIR